MFVMYTFCTSDLMYAKFIQNVSIQILSQISTNFCIQNVYKIFVYKMHPTFRQTFVYILYTKCIQKFVEMQYTFCICISCIHLIQFLYIKSIQSFHVGYNKITINTIYKTFITRSYTFSKGGICKVSLN